MLSIFAPHFFNWTEQLKDSGHQIFWLDIFDSNTQVQQIDFVEQIIGWRYRWDYPGRFFIKSKMPRFNNSFNIINERKLSEFFDNKLQEIKPDLVHSFVMHLSCFPIESVMKNYPKIKWAYSSWGSDLFYYQDNQEVALKIRNILPSIDYMFADCYRDYKIARDFGFSGEFMGVFPGGGGYEFAKIDPFIKPVASRRTLLIKGYQGKHGRCIEVLMALLHLRENLKDYKIIVFGANREVKGFVADTDLREWVNLQVLEKISNENVLKLMGEAIIYIGNSASDGMPNTLLEAIIMGAFPIQSDPGGATSEIIFQKINGLLIENPEDINNIIQNVLFALENPERVKKGIDINLKKLKPNFEREMIRKQVLKKYQLIEDEL